MKERNVSTWNLLKRGAVALIAIITVCDASCFEKKLLRDLFFDYDKDTRPVLNDSHTVTVTIGLSLHQIMDVDEKNQIMTTSVWARQKWYNPYMKWNRSAYGNIATINVPSKRIWIPDIVLYNNADENVDFRGYLDRLSTRVQIDHDGLNTWLSPVMLKTKCKINVEYFPFDSQRCILKFGSWTYDGFRLDVQNESTSIDTGMYSASAEWHLSSVPVQRNVVKYFCCPEPYPDVTFVVNIQRRSLFYLINLILPLVVISVLITFVFTLPPESGERISLSITILLAMTVFMLLVTETIPPTSEVVPLIAKFYMAAMCEIAFALIVTCYILRCYHSGANEVPSWMKRILVGTMANFFGVKKSKALLKMEKEEEMFEQFASRKGFLGKMIKKLTQEDSEEDLIQCCVSSTVKEDIDVAVSNLQLPQLFKTPLKVDEKDKTNDVKGAGNRCSDRFSSKILDKLDIITNNIKSKEKVEIVKEQWHIISVVCDRISMWTFALAIIVTMTMIFYQAPGYIS